MFDWPMSSPQMTTMLGFLSAISFSFFRLPTSKGPRIDSPHTISRLWPYFVLPCLFSSPFSPDIEACSSLFSTWEPESKRYSLQLAVS